MTPSSILAEVPTHYAYCVWKSSGFYGFPLQKPDKSVLGL